MRQNSFAFMAMSVIAVALMCSIIPSESFEFVYAEEDEATQGNDSEENQNDDDGSDNEDDGDNARSQEEDDGGDDDEDNDDESSRSQDDDESEDGNEDGDDSSETGTGQESEQKNVCSGWAVCINVATNAESSGIGGGSPTQSETPMLLSLPL